MNRRLAFSIFGVVLLLVGSLRPGRAQHLTSLAEVATGEGTLTLTNGKRLRITAVAVFLHENGKAEVRLITERESVNAGGRWSRDSDAGRKISLAITDDTEGGCASGWGTVFLQEGCVPVATLAIAVSRLDGTTFEAYFLEKKSRPCPNP